MKTTKKRNKLILFEIRYTNIYGIGIHKQRAINLRDAYNRCPAKIQQRFFEITNTITGETLNRSEFGEAAFNQL